MVVSSRLCSSHHVQSRSVSKQYFAIPVAVALALVPTAWKALPGGFCVLILRDEKLGIAEY